MVTETLSIKVSKAEKNTLRQIARARRSTTSALLRQALQTLVGPPAADGGSLLERHAHLLTELDRGPGDLSTNRARLRGYGK